MFPMPGDGNAAEISQTSVVCVMVTLGMKGDNLSDNDLAVLRSGIWVHSKDETDLGCKWVKGEL